MAKHHNQKQPSAMASERHSGRPSSGAGQGLGAAMVTSGTCTARPKGSSTGPSPRNINSVPISGGATTGSCCGKSCTNAHGTTSCAAGACKPDCVVGYYDCDRNPATGCETQLGTRDDCDSCGDSCVIACLDGSCFPF